MGTEHIGTRPFYHGSGNDYTINCPTMIDVQLVCVQLDMNFTSMIVVYLPFCDIIEARQADTRDTHALHKLIPRQLSCVADMCVCNSGKN